MKLLIKPLSVNQCWQGKRFKTPTYKVYEKALLLMMPKATVPPGKLKIEFRFGFSNSLCDWDNPIKPFQDVLQKKYGFNDKDIHEAIVKKELVKKGDEFIECTLTLLETNQIIF